MLEEICVRRRAGRKFQPGSILSRRWLILPLSSHHGVQIDIGYSNRGIKIVREISTGKLCVLKMLSPEICYPGHAAREICILRELNRHGDTGHATILRFLDWDDGSRHPHDIPWMVTELCDRGTLAQLVDKYASLALYLPEAFLWHVFGCLAAAMQFCHSQGIVHRDITLANVFLQSSTTKDTYPKIQLGDFGSAATEEYMAQLSLGSLLPGNPKFMPPEGCKARSACDIYQVGLVVLCLLMCDSNPTESLGDFFNGQDIHGRQFSRGLKDLVTWCLSKEAAQRPTAAILAFTIQTMVSNGWINGQPEVFESLIEVREKIDCDLGTASL